MRDGPLEEERFPQPGMRDSSRQPGTIEFGLDLTRIHPFETPQCGSWNHYGGAMERSSRICERHVVALVCF
jgi:hypothetical protein